jgi:hypothetical protein
LLELEYSTLISTVRSMRVHPLAPPQDLRFLDSGRCFSRDLYLWYYLSFREEFVVLDLDHLTERPIVRCWEVNKASSTSGQALEEKAQ